LAIGPFNSCGTASFSRNATQYRDFEKQHERVVPNEVTNPSWFDGKGKRDSSRSLPRLLSGFGITAYNYDPFRTAGKTMIHPERRRESATRPELQRNARIQNLALRATTRASAANPSRQSGGCRDPSWLRPALRKLPEQPWRPDNALWPSRWPWLAFPGRWI
jgi:hypothetical protein